MFGSGQVNRPVHFVKGSLFYMCLRHGQCELSHHLARSCMLGRTWQVDGIGVAKLLCSLEELVIGHRREERDHVVQPVMPDGGQLLRPSVVSGLETPHPLIKDGISKGVKNLQSRHGHTHLLSSERAQPPLKHSTNTWSGWSFWKREKRVIWFRWDFYRMGNQESSWED